eukprot:gene4465-6314_t
MSAFEYFLPGQLIIDEPGYLRGYGTTTTSNGSSAIISCNSGRLKRVDKLVSIQPANGRYIGEIGDLVVGRITMVDSKRWKVDLNGPKDAVLNLASVDLPGGVQRMKTYEDQLQMRSLYIENDLISSEIQTVTSDGVVSLASRSLKYGKLQNGQLICVSSSLIKRLPQHHVSLPFGIDVLIGNNGYIWITRSIPKEWRTEDEKLGGVESTTVEVLQALKSRHNNTPLIIEERLKVARVYNSINVLSHAHVQISPQSIMTVYQKSLDMLLKPKDMINLQAMEDLAESLLE